MLPDVIWMSEASAEAYEPGEREVCISIRDPAAPVPDLSPQLRAVLSLEVDDDPEGTREWFVIHHTNCGMETFTDEVMRGLLAQSLGTAIFDGRGWRDAGPGPGSAEGELLTGSRSRTSSVVSWLTCAAFGTIPLCHRTSRSMGTSTT